MTTSSIMEDLISPKLYKGTYYEVVDVISTIEEGTGPYSCNGTSNIVKLSNDIILKYSNIDMSNEIKYQEIVASFGKAPKIYEHYKYNGYTFIFMENLLSKGYKTLDNFRLTGKMIDKICEALRTLHINKISHGDAHMWNIFYNQEMEDIIFIDFSYSKINDTEKQAFENERFKFYSGFVKKSWGKIKKRLSMKYQD